MTAAPQLKLFGLVGLWLLMLAGFALFVPQFFNSSTITSVLQFSTILALVTLGQSLVILAGGGGIDLSVGGMASLAGLAMAMVVQAGLGDGLGILAALALGALLGGLNGLLVTRLGIVPLIATLGTFYVYAGLALALTGGRPIGGMAAWLMGLGSGRLGPLPWHFLALTLPLYALALVALRATPAGRWLYAMGGNETAARLVGIPVAQSRFLVYALSGVLAALAAVVANAWLLSARPNIGQNLELESLTAALLGGIAISGGSGHVLGPLAAVLFLVSLKTGLQLANVNSIWQIGTIGLLLILTVFADRFLARRS
jgi:ribose/xylose/arabinose/galactoside ABC-type transport system permease subunit